MMSAIFKRYEGSKLEEVLVQAGVVAAGPVQQALKGKHFKRGLRCLRLFHEALTSKLIKPHVPNLSETTKIHLELVRDVRESKQVRTATYETLEKDKDIETLVSSIFSHVNGSDMADYWMDFFLMTDSLMQSVHAVHALNLDEYISSLRTMLPWFIAYDRINYGRWLPDFWAMLITLPANQAEFLRANFPQSITGNPYSNIGWDMWIECTMNKGSKMKSGWLSILKNEKQLRVHSRNVNNLAHVRAVTNATANRKKSKWKHSECIPRRLREDEQCIQNLVSCLTEFEAYPFDPDFPVLRTMQSGVHAPKELIEDFKSGHEDGEKRLVTLMDERVYTKIKSIHARMNQMNRKTFVNLSDDHHTEQDLKGKAAAMEQVALKSVINLVERSEAIDLNDLLEHCVVEECTSIFNSNKTYRKINKSQLIQCLKFDAVHVREPYTALVDMGMVWRMAIPSSENRIRDDDGKLMWSDYAKNVSNIILNRHHNAERIICVNDVYDTQYSIKDDERQLRIQGMGHIPNEHFKFDNPFPSTAKFNSILCSKTNKFRLQKFLQRYITEKARDINIEILYSIGKECTNLSTNELVQELGCDQFEADTVIFSIYANLRNTGYRRPVVVDAADTDIYVAASYISRVYPGDLLMKRKGELVDCKKFVNDSMVECIIPMHCMTGCDANSGFFGKGKKKTFENIEKSQIAQKQISQCGESLILEEDVLQSLMQFTQLIMYGDAGSKSMAEARAKKWKSLKNKNFSRLPPDEDSLRQHCKRANYLAYIVRHPSIKNHPSPIGNGWEIISENCRPLRYTKPSLPYHLTPLTEFEEVQQNINTSGDPQTEQDDTDDETECIGDMEYDDIDSDSFSEDNYSDLESD